MYLKVYVSISVSVCKSPCMISFENFHIYTISTHQVDAVRRSSLPSLEPWAPGMIKAFFGWEEIYQHNLRLLAKCKYFKAFN